MDRGRNLKIGSYHSILLEILSRIDLKNESVCVLLHEICHLGSKGLNLAGVLI